MKRLAGCVVLAIGAMHWHVEARAMAGPEDDIEMSVRILAFTFSALATITLSSTAEAQYWAGACGGMMRGYDGREYPCESTRKPVCQQSTGRCVCLEKRECGARHDQSWYDSQ